MTFKHAGRGFSRNGGVAAASAFLQHRCYLCPLLLKWSDSTVWLDKAQTTGFAGVPQNVWNYHIGGYQVCQKWLKDRKGRTLSADDLAHCHKIVVALNETIRLQAEIDTLYPRVEETLAGVAR